MRILNQNIKKMNNNRYLIVAKKGERIYQNKIHLKLIYEIKSTDQKIGGEM